MARNSRKRKSEQPRKSKSVARRYSEKTLKKLFTLSLNECAFPDCTNKICIGPKPESDQEIVGHICHIYAASEDGPRGKSGLKPSELNAFDNLILMCGYHHPIVDKQPDSYPADQLILWKRLHEAKAYAETSEAIKREADIQKHAFMADMSDEKIEQQLTQLRQGRHLVGYDTLSVATTFAAQVQNAKFSAGHDEIRAKALAWCARILGLPPNAETAKGILAESIKLARTPEATIAEAFILSATNKNDALALLAKANSTAARSASLRIVANADGNDGAVDWAAAAGLTIDSFDADGKFTYLTCALYAYRWDEAISAAEKVGEADFEEYPALMHLVALSKVASTIAVELRSNAIMQVPLQVNSVPIGSTQTDITARRQARVLLERVEQFAKSIGATPAVHFASDYALWLGLRDPDQRNEALTLLRESLLDEEVAIRRVNFAIQNGIKLDLKAIEQRIDQNVALSGKGSAEDAVARLSIALSKKPKEVADDIDRHRAQLVEFLDPNVIDGFEIEALARAGLIESATEKLTAATQIPEREREILTRVIAEQAGADPVAGKRAQFEKTKELASLVVLVGALEEKKLWLELIPFAEEYFKRTRSVEACELCARSLNEAAKFGELYEFLRDNPALVRQSDNLKMLWGWTLYREGEFEEARKALADIPNRAKELNARQLRTNIAVASGAWSELQSYTDEVWASHDEYSAMELLHAAKLAIAVNGVNSRKLAEAAVAKEPKNPHVLIGAYSLATSAGWEQNAEVSGWMQKAAELSDADGPIKAVTLQELTEMKPDWDKKSQSLWDQLKAGKLPTFLVAQAQNRSLLDFYLTPSLLNPLEADVRRRTVVYAYSGARGTQPLGGARRIALDLGAVVTLSRLRLLNKVIEHFDVVIPHSTLGWLFEEKQKATFHQPSQIKDAIGLKRLLANGTLHILNAEGPRDDRLIREIGNEAAALLSAAKSRSIPEKKIVVVKSYPQFKINSFLTEPADVSGFEANLVSSHAVIDRMAAKGTLTAAEEDTARSFLKLQEKRWPSEVSLDENTEIYLDGVAVAHLRAAGVLEKLKLAQITSYVVISESEEADALIALQNLGTDQIDEIERIRASLESGLSSRRVKALRIAASDEADDVLRLHPTYGVLSFGDKADALVVDDRYVNQNRNLAMGSKLTPIACTLDVLDHLQSIGVIKASDSFAYRTTLRRWGYQLIPVTLEELQYHLDKAQGAGGTLVETGELRAIREALLRARMSSLVQIPLEASYLHNSMNSFIKALKQAWGDLSIEKAKERGEYLLEMLDIRGWAASAVEGNERNFVVGGYAAYGLQLSNPPDGIDAERKSAYFEWVEEKLLKDLKEYSPDAFKFMVAQARDLVTDFAEAFVKDYDKSGGDHE
ncbi:MAG TPA: hypothetical protein VIM56_07360 [Rhizomicrobium sp.]